MLVRFNYWFCLQTTMWVYIHQGTDSSLNLIHRCIKQSMAEKHSDQLKLPVKHDASLLSWARQHLSLILFWVTAVLNRITASLTSPWVSTMPWWDSPSRSSALSRASLQTFHPEKLWTGLSHQCGTRLLIPLQLLNDGYFSNLLIGQIPDFRFCQLT